TVAGAVQAIAVAPDGNAAFLGTVAGGVWWTDNINQVAPLTNAVSPHWVPLTDRADSLSIGALALDPSDATVVYAGTGSFSSAKEGGPAVGLLRIAKSGTNPATITPLGHDDLSGLPVTGIVALNLQRDGKRILFVSTLAAGERGGIFLSTDGGRHFSALSGSGGLPAGSVSDLVLGANASTVYAALPGQGIYQLRLSTVNYSVETQRLTGAVTAIEQQSTRIRLAVHNNGTAHTAALYA